MEKKILILDYSLGRNEGGLIRQCLPADVRAAVITVNTGGPFPDHVLDEDYTHVVHSGSELSVTEPAASTRNALHVIRMFKERHTPQMGICFGHQLMSLAIMGAQSVRKSPLGMEAGWCRVSFLKDEKVKIPGISGGEVVFQHHFDEVVELPEGSRIIATNGHTRIQAYVNPGLHLFGVQFHPEYDRDPGNRYFEDDRYLLEANGIDVDEILRHSPSMASGRAFFDFFLGYFG